MKKSNVLLSSSIFVFSFRFISSSNVFNRNLSLFNEDKDDDYPNQVNKINNKFNYIINIGRKGGKHKKIGFIR